MVADVVADVHFEKVAVLDELAVNVFVCSEAEVSKREVEGRGCSRPSSPLLPRRSPDRTLPLSCTQRIHNFQPRLPHPFAPPSNHERPTHRTDQSRP